jgi:hypothetical protein
VSILNRIKCQDITPKNLYLQLVVRAYLKKLLKVFPEFLKHIEGISKIIICTDYHLQDVRGYYCPDNRSIYIVSGKVNGISILHVLLHEIGHHVNFSAGRLDPQTYTTDIEYSYEEEISADNYAKDLISAFFSPRLCKLVLPFLEQAIRTKQEKLENNRRARKLYAGITSLSSSWTTNYTSTSHTSHTNHTSISVIDYNNSKTYS